MIRFGDLEIVLEQKVSENGFTAKDAEKMSDRISKIKDICCENSLEFLSFWNSNTHFGLTDDLGTVYTRITINSERATAEKLIKAIASFEKVGL